MAIDLDKYTGNEWFKPDDLEEGERPVVTVDELYEHKFPSGDEGLVVEFREQDKKLALNKTRARKLRELLGDDTDAWVGKQISLYAIEVQMNGKTVGSVAIGPVPKKKAARVIPSSDDDDSGPDVVFGNAKN